VTTVHLVVPAGFDDPRRPSGGNVYDRRLREALGGLGRSVQVHAVPGPWLRRGASTGRSAGGSAGVALAQVLRAIPDGEVVVVDGLVGCGEPEVVVPESARLRLVALVHMPLGSIESPDQSAARTREAAVLERSAAVISTSHWCRRWLHDAYPLAPPASVAEPAVDPADLAHGTPSGGHLLCVATISPVKGHDVLVEALSGVRDLDWTCTCAGATTVDADFAALVAERAALHGLTERVRIRGALSGAALDLAYAEADLLVLPSRAETYGMVVTEALARGLPVIASDVGGVSEALGAERPGALVPADNPAALAGALRRWMTDAGWRLELQARARARRNQLGRWPATAERVVQVVDAVAAAPMAVAPSDAGAGRDAHASGLARG
jgi:glycosyltransferase involved in cell wall biosynthesis